MQLTHLLADVVLLLHAAIVVFVVGGLVLIVVGNLQGWRWVNALWFRVAHVGAIVVVVVQAWTGVVCPLTTLEMWLRVEAGQTPYAGTFVQHWVQRLLYYDAPGWVFVALYSAFGLIVLAAWWYFPPHRPRARVR